IAQYMTSAEIAKLWSMYRVPIVWTVVDMAPMTGGCHYTHGCTAYEKRCGACPVIRSAREHDMTRYSWENKKRRLGGLPLQLVGATDWVVERVRRSSLFGHARVEKIPYGLDLEVF